MCICFCKRECVVKVKGFALRVSHMRVSFVIKLIIL